MGAKPSTFQTFVLVTPPERDTLCVSVGVLCFIFLNHLAQIEKNRGYLSSYIQNQKIRKSSKLY